MRASLIEYANYFVKATMLYTKLPCLFSQKLFYIDDINRVGSHVVSVRIHCREKWRTSFHTDVLSKSK